MPFCIVPFHYIVYDFAKVVESSLFFLKEYLSKMMGNRYLIGYISMFLNMSNAIVVSIPD